MRRFIFLLAIPLAACGGVGDVSTSEAAERYARIADAGLIIDTRDVDELADLFAEVYAGGFECDDEQSKRFVFAMAETERDARISMALNVAFCPDADVAPAATASDFIAEAEAVELVEAMRSAVAG